MTLKSNTKFEKYGKYSPEYLKVSFYKAKWKNYELKIYRGVMCHDKEE